MALAHWRNEKWFVPPNQRFCLASLVAQLESTCNVEDLDWEDHLEKGSKWLPTPVFCPGEFHGLYSLWDRKEPDIIKQLSFTLSF